MQWCHIAKQQLSPWWAMFHVVHPMLVVSLADTLEADFIRISCTAQFSHQIHFLATLDFDLQWSFLLFEVAWSRRTLGSLQPNTFDIRLVKDAGETSFWHPDETAAPRAKPDPWSVMLAEKSGDEAMSTSGDSVGSRDSGDEEAEPADDDAAGSDKDHDAKEAAIEDSDDDSGDSSSYSGNRFFCFR